jgi:predicted Zn finger-like uncharacterized protein
MKITCHVCGASFLTSDEKIRGRLVKYHCRKCNAVLTADGTSLPPPAEASAGPSSLDAPLDLTGLVALPSDQAVTAKMAPRIPATPKEMNWDEEPTVHRASSPPAAPTAATPPVAPTAAAPTPTAAPTPAAASPAAAPKPSPFSFPLLGGMGAPAAKRAAPRPAAPSPARPPPAVDRSKTQPGLGVTAFDPVQGAIAAPPPMRPPREASIELSAELIPPSGDIVDENEIEDAPPSSGLPVPEIVAPLARAAMAEARPVKESAPWAVPEIEALPSPVVPARLLDAEPTAEVSLNELEAPPSSGMPLSMFSDRPKPPAEASARVNLDDLLSLGDPAPTAAMAPSTTDWDFGAAAGPLWQTPEPEPVAPVNPEPAKASSARPPAPEAPSAALFESARVGSLAPAISTPNNPPRRSPAVYVLGGLAAVAALFAFRAVVAPSAPDTATASPARTAEPSTRVEKNPSEPTAAEPTAATTAEPTATAPVATAEPTATATTADPAPTPARVDGTTTTPTPPPATATATPTPVTTATPTPTAPTATATATPAPTPTATATPTPTATTAPVAPTVMPPASGSDEFNKDAARGALASAAGSAASCAKADGPKGVAKVQVTFSTSGRVTQAQIAGPPFAGTPVGGCIAAAFRRASVPPFSGSPVTVVKTVSIQLAQRLGGGRL